MATIRRFDSKGALGRQRAQLRRSSHGKAHIGDDAGAAAGRAAELARVHQMQVALQAREAAAAQIERERTERREAPWVGLLAEVAMDGFRLTRTLVMLPFRLAGAMLGAGARASEA